MKIITSGRFLTHSRIILASYLVVIALGAMLLMLPAATVDGISVIDAFFTSTSAVCVTGLIVKSTPTDFTGFGQYVILALIQIGGLGYMAFSTLLALFFGKKIGLSERMLLKESLNISSLENILSLLKRIVFFVALVEGAGILVLTLLFFRDMAAGEALRQGVFHSISAFNNAGFSLFDTSLMGYRCDPLINISIMLLIILGGIGFIVVIEVVQHLREPKKHFHYHSKIVLSSTLVLIVFGAILFYTSEHYYLFNADNDSLFGNILVSTFSSVTSRTAGFNTIDFSLLQPITLFLIIILMFIGASPGSTGGGIKTTTFSVVLVYIISSLSGQEDTVLFKRRIPQRLIIKAFLIFTLSVMYLGLTSFAILSIEHTPFEKTVFEVVSAFSTVGLSVGDGGVRSFSATFSDPSKFIMIITMIIGRVGPITLFSSLIQRRTKEYRYPESGVVIG